MASTAAKENCQCSGRKKPGKRNAYPVVVGVMIALLPKCPFCILAYSSAVTMCSGTGHTPGVLSFLSIGLALVIILSLMFNYRGYRTLLALSAALAGGILVAVSELITGNLGSYQSGAYLLLFAALANGSLFHFVQNILRSYLPLKH